MAIDEDKFPQLKLDGYEITSCPDRRYNCIAWAAGYDDRLIDPTVEYGWPDDVPREVTVEALVAVLRKERFEICDDGILEPGFEKIAIYGVEEEFEHASRQLEDGSWTSKMGIPDDDIRHPHAESVAGDFYGPVIRFLKRERKGES